MAEDDMTISLYKNGLFVLEDSQGHVVRLRKLTPEEMATVMQNATNLAEKESTSAHE